MTTAAGAAWASLNSWQAILLGVGVGMLVFAFVSTRIATGSGITPTESKTPPEEVATLPWATKEELAEPIITRRRVRLVDAVSDSGSPLISNKEFRQCLLVGPAFLGAVAPPGPHLIGRQLIDAPVSSVVVPMEPKPTSGVIGLIAVTFRECAFQRVGFGVPLESLNHWRRTWTLAVGGALEEPPEEPDQEAINS